jgi:hypothetical protein
MNVKPKTYHNLNFLPNLNLTLSLNLILVLLLAVFAIAPLTFPGFFQAHSGYLPAWNVAHIAQAPDWGRAADLLRGEGKLPYLLAWPFFKLSGSGLVAVKWGYALAFLLGALGVYAWTRHLLGTKGAVLAAAVYTYLPWHLSAVYVRGAYAEAWLWAFLPFTLWAIDRLAERRPRATVAAATVGLLVLAAAAWAQAGLTALFLPILIGYGVVVALNRKGMIVGLVLDAALSFIMLLGLAQTAAPAAVPFADHFLYPYQLLAAAWGFGSSVPGWADGMSFQLGVAAVGLTIVAIALRLGREENAARPSTLPSRTFRAIAFGRNQIKSRHSEERKRRDEVHRRISLTPRDQRDSSLPEPALSATEGVAQNDKCDCPARTFWFWGAVLLVLVILTLLPLALLWRISHLQSLLTYPWQVLALAGLPLAFLAGSALKAERRLAELPMWAGLLALVILASYPYLAPHFTQVDPGREPVARFQPLGADVPQIMLLDDQIVPPTDITPTLALTLTWQAVAPVTDDYTVFVHLLAGADTKAAQLDSRPCGGECPTNTWQPGEIVVDRYQLVLVPGAPPGPYHLAIGLYLLDTGQRAAVAGRDDQTVYVNVP